MRPPGRFGAALAPPRSGPSRWDDAAIERAKALLATTGAGPLGPKCKRPSPSCTRWRPYAAHADLLERAGQHD